jgi:hypothetical protein
MQEEDSGGGGRMDDDGWRRARMAADGVKRGETVVVYDHAPHNPTHEKEGRTGRLDLLVARLARFKYISIRQC